MAHRIYGYNTLFIFFQNPDLSAIHKTHPFFDKILKNTTILSEVRIV